MVVLAGGICPLDFVRDFVNRIAWGPDHLPVDRRDVPVDLLALTNAGRREMEELASKSFEICSVNGSFESPGVDRSGVEACGKRMAD